MNDIVRSAEEIASKLDKIRCEDCELYNENCRYNDKACHEHWIDWLTVKESE